MSYNNKYNTRHSGRFNSPGQFVSSGELAGGAAPGGQRQQNNPNFTVGQPFQSAPFQQQPPLPPLPPQPAPQRAPPPQSGLQRAPLPQSAPPPQSAPQRAQPPPLPQNQNQNQNMQQQQSADVEMKTEQDGGDGSEGPSRPHWMKSKLIGVKKISNKERRRRQNENLRRLLTPKNALMVLNEMMPNEQLATQFKVEPSSNQFYKAATAHSFCADLTLDGNVYKGYGENKLSARNAAAEKAIRDLIIKRMTKVFTNEIKEVTKSESPDGAGGGAGGEAEEALPMIQLASFALHKLFSEWEYEGVKVPQLKQQHHSTGSEPTEPLVPAPPRPRPAAPPKRKELPPNADALHPCMLLTYMRPGLEYRELAVTGDKPQAMLFTMGVDVDGATYIGKASNKKEARRMAARSACAALFGVRFPDTPPPPAAPAAPAAPQPMAEEL